MNFAIIFSIFPSHSHPNNSTPLPQNKPDLYTKPKPQHTSTTHFNNTLQQRVETISNYLHLNPQNLILFNP
jgi:hypothetical protein